MSRYLDPTNDVAFKKVFRDEGRLKDFLNAILRLEGNNRIASLEFIPQEEIPDIGQGKRSIFDLKCKDESGKIFVVEMQNRKESDFIKRMQFYASHTYVSQLSIGKTHIDLVPVILVAISKENLFPSDVKCISYHTTKEEETNRAHLFELSYVFIELKKFKKSEGELASIEDYWLYFLARSEEVKTPPKSIKDEYVIKAYETIEQFNWTTLEYDAYIRARLLAEVEAGRLEMSYEQGLEKGIEKGIEKGKAEGLSEGESKRNMEIAKKMLTKGRPVEEIVEFTGLSEEAINKLR
jgi:predicted transposase/invertase (TIGR01784 family)